MMQLTMDLQGHKTHLEQEFETTAQPTATTGWQGELFGGMDALLPTQQKSMSK
jgi:hypothetical protein